MSARALDANFVDDLGSHLRDFKVGDARLEFTGRSLRLVNEDATAQRYSNAQLDDYRGLPRRDFLWSPPLRLTVHARFSHPGHAGQEPLFLPGNRGSEALTGTAGFGFWNDPFLMTGKRRPALPRAIWFFYASPPSNMKLDLRTPGWGWKAATIDALRWPFLALAPTMPIAVPLMSVPALYRRLWPIGQQAIHVSEAPLDVDMTRWHSYVLDWGRHSARFQVDGDTVLLCRTPPRGPLGLVIWIDNQYMVVTPQGRLGHGLLAHPGRQWLELTSVTVD